MSNRAAVEFSIGCAPVHDVDRQRIVEIVNSAFSVYPFCSDARLAGPEELTSEAGLNAQFVVIEHKAAGGVACAMLRPSLDVNWDIDPAIAIRAADAQYLGLVAVVPSRHRRGLGSMLVAEAERKASLAGFKRVVLGTIREMGNVDYYARFGYAVSGAVVCSPGHWGLTIAHEFCVMEKTL